MQPKRRGLVALISGLVLMLIVAPVVFGVGAWYGAKHLGDIAKSAKSVSQGGTVTLAADEHIFVMVDVGPSSKSDFSVTSDTGIALESCDVSGPAGQATADSGVQGIQVSYQGREYHSAGVFTAPAAGDYTVSCSAGPTKVITGDAASNFAGGTIMPVLVGFGLATLAGLLGLILTIVGIVKLVRSGRERSAYAAQSGGYGQPGYGQQAYGQPTFGQPTYGQPTYGQAPPPPPPGQTGQSSPSASYPPPPGQDAPPPPNYPPPPGGSGSGGQGS